MLVALPTFYTQLCHMYQHVCLQVALGDSNELLDADYEAHKLPAGKHSTKGLGVTGPDPKNAVMLLVLSHLHI